VPKPTEAELQAAWEQPQALLPVPVPLTPKQRVSQLEAENAGLALELAQAHIRIDQQEQVQAEPALDIIASLKSWAFPLRKTVTLSTARHYLCISNLLSKGWLGGL
jgi:hypothetical protein